MKKTTKRDEKGYLGSPKVGILLMGTVTKNDWVYESFSEDEESDVPKVKKAAPVPAATAGDKKKGKQAAVGQKNLMSFFGKK
jgi:DNA polymerase subunit Cdc27